MPPKKAFGGDELSGSQRARQKRLEAKWDARWKKYDEDVARCAAQKEASRQEYIAIALSGMQAASASDLPELARAAVDAILADGLIFCRIGPYEHTHAHIAGDACTGIMEPDECLES